MKASAKTIKCSCGGTFEKTSIGIQGIKSEAMVCSGCKDIVFTMKQSEKYQDSQKKLKEIIEAIPEGDRSPEIEMLMANHLHKEKEYILLAIKSAYKKMNDDFVELLSETLKNDYARHDRKAG